MNVTEENMLDSIKWCVEQISAHVDGDVGSSHIPVSKVNNGFMTPKLLAFATGERFKDNYLFERYPATTDLPPGRYATTANFTDNPPEIGVGAICQVEVYMENETRKQIIFVDGYSGRVFLKTIHGDNVRAPNDWTKIERSTVIWQGAAKTTGTAMALKDSLTKFDRLRITLEASGVSIREIPVPAYGTTSVVSATNLYDAENSASAQMMECQLKATGGSTLVISLNKAVVITGAAANVITNDPITIQKIEGIK
jgi:hypothetical protein